MAALVDINKKKIYGCKKNSLTWWHEKGHIQFNTLEKASRNQLRQAYVLELFFFLF